MSCGSISPHAQWRKLFCSSLALLAMLAIAGCQRGAPPLMADEVHGGDQHVKSGAGGETVNAKGPLPPNPFPARQKAPGLDGGAGWLNVAGPIELESLRGKFVLLDFWTYCCINCMHILPELKKLEHAYPNELVVIGVHSAKFETEQDSRNITDAAMRYEIEHPIVNDAEHVIWNKYGVQSWPTIVLIDPEGYRVGSNSGEFTFEMLKPVFDRAIPYYQAKGVMDPTPLRFDLAEYQAQPTPLRYPGKVLADEASDRLYIADSNHNRIVVATLDGTLVETIGSSAIGLTDGDYAKAAFNKPQGMALRGDTLYVADTENHALRKVDLKAMRVSTIAGDGIQSRGPWPGEGTDRFVAAPSETGLNSPWDLLIHGEDLYIAMAGPHQIWKMTLDEREIGPYAGNGAEDIVDGELLPAEPYQRGYSSFAQPSGLATDGQELFVADSEGSSIRGVPFDPSKEARTIIGTAHLPYGRLFAFGDVDGKSPSARLQHALGVVWYDGKVYVADTYNNKIKVVDVANQTVASLSGDGEPGSGDSPARFDEPAGISAAAGKLYIADTNNHAIRTIDLANGNRVATLTIVGLEPPADHRAPPTQDAASDEVELPQARAKGVDGQLRLAVEIALPAGFKINTLGPARYRVETVGEAGAVDAAKLTSSVKLEKPAAKFDILLPLRESNGEGTLRVTTTYYYCQEGAEGVCKVGTATWKVPYRLSADGEASIALAAKAE